MKVEKLGERVNALDRSQSGRKRPLLMGEPEGEAWVWYCILYLSDDERRELWQVEADIERGNETRPEWKSPQWQALWDEHMRLIHRHGEIIKLGEVRAEAAPWDPWLKFLAEYGEAQAQADLGGE